MKADYPLAVITGRLGACSETFVKRHMYELAKGRTTAIAAFVDRSDVCWDAPGPVLLRGSELSYKVGRLGRRCVASLASVGGAKVPVSIHWHKRVKEFLSRHGTRVVLGEFLDVSYEYLSVLNELGIPFFAHAHGYDVSMNLRSPRWRQRYGEFSKWNDIITMSQASRSRLIDIGIRAEKIHVVPYGVAVTETFPKKSKEKNGNVVRVIAVGRMVAKKAPLLLVEAFRKALEVYPGMHLDYIGTGPMSGAVERYVSSNRLGDRITLHGALGNEDVRDMMRHADVFLQHSVVDPRTGDSEGLPVAILEAMAEGLPVIATRHAGIPEEVVEGVTGLLVNEGDTEAMSEKLVEVAEAPGMRMKLGYQGWKRVLEHFSFQKECSRLREVLGLSRLNPPASEF